MSSNVHEARVLRKSPLADGVVEVVLRLEPPEPLRFRPGQFVSLRVGEDEHGDVLLRSYSIASSPGRPELSLIVKIVSGGAASSWFSHAGIGEHVRFTGPMGFFVLDLQHAGDVVFGATGTGIAPVLPMLDELLARNEPGRVRVYWGNRHERDLFWRDELEARRHAHARFDYRLYLSQPEARLEAAPAQPATVLARATGHITAPLVAESADLERPTFYLVGNGHMIHEAKAALMARGVDRKRQIRNEAFFD